MINSDKEVSDSPVERVYNFIEAAPGSTLRTIANGTGLSETLIDSILVDLKIHNRIGAVGSKYYDTEHHADVIPNLSDIYRVVRNNPTNGMSFSDVVRETQYPEGVVRSELAFLRKSKMIYTLDNRFYPTFRPVPLYKKPLLERVDELTYDELKALVKLFIQSTTWAVESIESAQVLLDTRLQLIKEREPENPLAFETSKENSLGGAFDSSNKINIQF